MVTERCERTARHDGKRSEALGRGQRDAPRGDSRRRAGPRHAARTLASRARRAEAAWVEAAADWRRVECRLVAQQCGRRARCRDTSVGRAL